MGGTFNLYRYSCMDFSMCAPQCQCMMASALDALTSDALLTWHGLLPPGTRHSLTVGCQANQRVWGVKHYMYLCAGSGGE